VKRLGLLRHGRPCRFWGMALQIFASTTIISPGAVFGWLGLARIRAVGPRPGPAQGLQGIGRGGHPWFPASSTQLLFSLLKKTLPWREGFTLRAVVSWPCTQGGLGWNRPRPSMLAGTIIVADWAFSSPRDVGLRTGHLGPGGPGGSAKGPLACAEHQPAMWPKSGRLLP